MLALAIFCLRLACGLAGALLILSPSSINPRFYRTQFLIVLGLMVLAAICAWRLGDTWLVVIAVAAGVVSSVGSIVWSLEGAPAGRLLIVVVFLLLAGGLAWSAWERSSLFSFPRSERLEMAERSSLGLAEDFAFSHRFGWLIAGDFTSAALLGTTTTAMLMGHSYLLAPAMSLTPLLRLLVMLFVTILARLLLSGVGLWVLNGQHFLFEANELTLLWLPVRWGIGFVGPLILSWMAWRTAKIRSTQSATGILYVVVILCFLGELTGQLLLTSTGYAL